MISRVPDALKNLYPNASCHFLRAGLISFQDWKPWTQICGRKKTGWLILGLVSLTGSCLLCLPAAAFPGPWTKDLRRWECIWSLCGLGGWMEAHSQAQRSDAADRARTELWGTSRRRGGASRRKTRSSRLRSSPAPLGRTSAATAFLAGWGRGSRLLRAHAGSIRLRSSLSRDMPGCKWCCSAWVKWTLAGWCPDKGRPWWVFFASCEKFKIVLKL